MKKFFKYSLLIILIGVIGYGIYFFFFKKNNKAEALKLIPANAIYIIETDEPIKSWKQISGSNIWKHMQTQPYFAELTASANSLDSLIRTNEKVFDILGSRKVIVSSHVYAPKMYDHLFIVDLQEASRLNFLQEYITKFPSKDYKISESKYKDVTVLQLKEIKTGSILYLSFVDNLVVCSYNEKIFQSSIDEIQNPKLATDERFIEIRKKADTGGLFNVYLNYNYFDEYMSCFLTERDETVDAISKALFYSGFDFYLDDQDKFMMKGNTGINDSVSTYLSAMLQSGKGSLSAHEVIPFRTAFYMSISVKDFKQFYDKLMEMMKAGGDPDYATHMKEKDKIEKYLKISLEENFISWIGDEVSFVQTQPKGLGKKNEYAVVIRANDKGKAKENLDHIVKQIRKRTPVKFQEFEYKGFPVNYMEVKGFFKLVLGKFFKGLDKPYYTIINDFVIFSNHPQTIKSIIDDYTAERTLKNSESFNEFLKDFDNSSNIFIYAHTPVLHSTLKEFLSPEMYASAEKNKDYIVCFSHIGFQLQEDGKYFKTKLVSLFQDPGTIQTEKIKSDSLNRDTISNDELYTDDLDSKTYVETYPNGNMKIQAKMKNGIRNGVYREYYEDGTLKVKGNYENDLREGAFKYYDENGALKETKKFTGGIEEK